MTIKKLPPLETLNNLFEYKDGRIYWKKSLSEHIKVGQRAGPKNRADTKNLHRRYRHVSMCKENYPEHRIIWKILKGYDPIEIDHINGIKNDNRIENLREVTHAENQRNQKLSRRNKSGTTGVFWHKRTNMWRAQIHTIVLI